MINDEWKDFSLTNVAQSFQLGAKEHYSVSWTIEQANLNTYMYV